MPVAAFLVFCVFEPQWKMARRGEPFVFRVLLRLATAYFARPISLK